MIYRDTVASVGLLYGRNLPFTTNNEGIRVFRHALSLDEVRIRRYRWYSENLIPYLSTELDSSPTCSIAKVPTKSLRKRIRNTPAAQTHRFRNPPHKSPLTNDHGQGWQRGSWQLFGGGLR